MNTHVFDQAIALTATGDSLYAGATSPAYANMVGPFGGITAATALNAVMQHPALLGEPLSLTVNFCAALADGPFAVSAQPVRTNRSTQHWVVAVTQTGSSGEAETVVTASVVTAARRETWSVDDEPMPPVPGPGEVAPYAVPAPVAWIQRYEMRPIEGAIPSAWDGAGSNSLSRLWMRDAQPRALDLCAVAALADVFFPRTGCAAPPACPPGRCR